MPSGPLKDGWDAEIPETAWPTALVSALRTDISALASPRVIATLRSWQEWLAGGDPVAAQAALGWLEAVAQSIVGAEGARARHRAQPTAATPRAASHDTFDTDSGVRPISTVDISDASPLIEDLRSEMERALRFDSRSDSDRRPPPPPPPDSRVGPAPKPLPDAKKRPVIRLSSKLHPEVAENTDRGQVPQLDTAKPPSRSEPQPKVPARSEPAVQKAPSRNEQATPKPPSRSEPPRPDLGPEAPTHTIDAASALAEVMSVDARDKLRTTLARTPGQTAKQRQGDPHPSQITQYAQSVLPAMVSSAFEDDEKPTTSIPIERLPSSAMFGSIQPLVPGGDTPTPGKFPSVPPPLPVKPPSSGHSSSAPARPLAPQKSPSLPPPLPKAAPVDLAPGRATAPVPSVHELASKEKDPGSPRFAPKPGIVRRRSGGRVGSRSARPRASMIQVRTLYAAIDQLCHELVPLSYERRSRRFWTHWRDVSGDRGVRREVAEELLEAATDARSLVADLIAEVHAVNPNSVRKLMDKIDEESKKPAGSGASPSARPRESIVGSSVQVEGIVLDDD